MSKNKVPVGGGDSGGGGRGRRQSTRSSAATALQSIKATSFAGKKWFKTEV